MESFRDLTQRDIELRESYGLDLVSKYMNENLKLLHLEEKKSMQTLLGRTEVFYVRKAKYNIGKLTINYKTDLKNKTSMSYVFQTRSFYPRDRNDSLMGKKQRTRGKGTD